MAYHSVLISRLSWRGFDSLEDLPQWADMYLNIARATHFYGFSDDGLLEMVKLLSVAYKSFRKQNF